MQQHEERLDPASATSHRDARIDHDRSMDGHPSLLGDRVIKDRALTLPAPCS